MRSLRVTRAIRSGTSRSRRSRSRSLRLHIDTPDERLKRRMRRLKAPWGKGGGVAASGARAGHTHCACHAQRPEPPRRRRRDPRRRGASDGQFAVRSATRRAAAPRGRDRRFGGPDREWARSRTSGPSDPRNAGLREKRSARAPRPGRNRPGHAPAVTKIRARKPGAGQGAQASERSTSKHRARVAGSINALRSAAATPTAERDGRPTAPVPVVSVHSRFTHYPPRAPCGIQASRPKRLSQQSFSAPTCWSGPGDGPHHRRGTFIVRRPGAPSRCARRSGDAYRGSGFRDPARGRSRRHRERDRSPPAGSGSRPTHPPQARTAG